MANKEKKNSKSFFEQDKWELGGKVSQDSYPERNGTKGISFKIGSKENYMGVAFLNTMNRNNTVKRWPIASPYEEYVFMKYEKILSALEIDYKNNKVKVDLSKLYPDIDVTETLSNLTGKWIKRISD